MCQVHRLSSRRQRSRIRRYKRTIREAGAGWMIPDRMQYRNHDEYEDALADLAFWVINRRHG